MSVWVFQYQRAFKWIILKYLWWGYLKVISKSLFCDFWNLKWWTFEKWLLFPFMENCHQITHTMASASTSDELCVIVLCTLRCYLYLTTIWLHLSFICCVLLYCRSHTGSWTLRKPSWLSQNWFWIIMHWPTFPRA